MRQQPNRHGACIVRVDGRRGVVWKIKYRDASGRQVMERLGREADGWRESKARAELEARLVDVRREGLTKPAAVTFGLIAAEWLATYPTAKGLKTSTADGYRSIVEKHLEPALGHVRVADLDLGHLERYVAGMLKEGAAPRTVNTHLNVIHAVLKAARRRKLVRENVAELVERPALPRDRWRILTPVEVARVETAFRELIADVDVEADTVGEELPWLKQARTVFLVVYGLGLRRGELLGLRWRNVLLADPAGPRVRIAETIVRGRQDTPKSAASERTLALGPKVAAELFEHRGRSSFAGEKELVFCHPQKGSPLDHKRYAETFRAALAKAEITDYVRPFHDGRHSAITNAAIAGNAPAAIQARAGHADFSTTQRYINLAGVVFREEAEREEARIFGSSEAAGVGHPAQPRVVPSID